MSDEKYWVGFSMVPGVGRVRLGKLLGYFGDLREAWHADPTELRLAGLDHRSAQSIITCRSKIQLEAEMEKLDRHRVRVLVQTSTCYPERLKHIYDAPPVLYVRGTLDTCDELSLSVVGSRNATIYGREVAAQLVADLVREGFTIVSGLARGIDTVAHRTALTMRGRTIAIFACGLDFIYPAENNRMAQEIIECGALISEHSLGTKPKAEYFPRRNRIMSGLSMGVLVVEAKERSGALITAHMALEQGREVFAVPGSILSPMSKGTNQLIQEGAKVVLDINDILEELNLSVEKSRQAKLLDSKENVPENEIESLICKWLVQEPLHIDELCRYCCLPVSQVSSALTMMELRGLVHQLGNMNYAITGS